MPRLAAHSCRRTCWGALQSDIGCVGDMTRAKKILIAMSFASLLCNALDAQDDSDRVNSNIGATVSFPLSPLRKLCIFPPFKDAELYSFRGSSLPDVHRTALSLCPNQERQDAIVRGYDRDPLLIGTSTFDRCLVRMP